MSSSLDKLRQEIDRIDDNLHSLIMQRSRAVEQIADLDEADALLRPGREAEILRRLVSRHQGRFPKATLIRLWRELIGGMCGVQGQMTVAVYMPERGAGFLELARDQYGAYTPMTAYTSPGQVVRAVADGSALVGVLPTPDREDIEPWWISLMGDGTPRIIAKLPFAGPGQGRGDGVEALAIARLDPDPTGYDRSWLAVETQPDISRARLRSVLGAAGLEPTDLAATQRGEDRWLHLVEISGALSADDRRIARLIDRKEPVEHCVVLGGYPVPLAAEDLSE